MTGPPLVSVIMPAKNAEPWIADAIQSCLRQTWQSLEVIVIDNGSTDRTNEIARAFTSPLVRVLECTRPGASAARNDGIAASHGDFIQFLDADDVLAPEKIAIQLETISAAPDGAVANGEWVRFALNLSERVFQPQPVWQDLSPEDFLITCWAGGWMMPVFSWLTPRSVIESAGPWNEALSVNDDGEFFTRVLLASSGIIFCDGAKGYYRTVPRPSISKRRDHSGLVSSLQSIDLSCNQLLMRSSSNATLNACACQYQRFAYDTYPDAIDLVRLAERRVHELGGCKLKCSGGSGFQLASTWFGWKFARRLQRLWHNINSASAADGIMQQVNAKG